MGSKSNVKDLKQYQDPTAGLQAAAGQQIAANRPNQSTPWANTSWSQGPNGQWSQQTGFAGPLGDVSNSLQGQAAQSMATPFSFGQFGAMPTGDSARDQAITGAYNQATSRLDPQWNQRESMERTRLLNQGFDPDSAASRNEMNQFGQQRNDAYGSAMNSAIAQGTAAGNSLFANNMASRQQGIVEALRQRGMPLEDMQKLQGFLAMPGFNQDSSGLQAAVSGAQLGQQGQDMYNRNYLGVQQNNNALLGDIIGGAGSLLSSGAGAAFLLSDEREKLNIVRHAEEALPGVPFATFEYKNQPGVKHLGVIAQDLEKVAPQFVREIDGMKHVDYSFLTGGAK